MELYATPGNSIPPNAILVPVRTRDGVTLRVARWAPRHAKGTVLLALGRSEFIEQYAEIIAGLVARQLEVVAFDWRGQGGSDREIRFLRRGYVSHFSAYRRDLEAVEQQVLEPFSTRPWFGLAHSMGAAVLLDQAHDGASPFERLVLSAPMIDLPLRHKAQVRRLVRLLDRCGLGSRLIPGGSELSLFLTKPFDGNIFTSDKRQFDRLCATIRHLPHLAVGAPTLRWLAAAFDHMRRFEHPRYPVETLIPALVLIPDLDEIVDPRAIERFAIRLKAGRAVTIPEARHQLMMEAPHILEQFWAAFDAFVPGTRAEEAAPEPEPKRSWLRALLFG